MADQKITDLAAVTTLADTDLFEVVVDVGGTPTNKKIAASDVATELGGGSIAPLTIIDANTVEQKNSTNSQVARWYKTDDGAGNYERVAIQVASSVFLLASEKGGTGSVRHI